MKLWQKVTLGMILGVLFGYYFPHYCEDVYPVGVIFLKMIKMVIIPVIFFSLVSGITSMDDPESLGRIGIKSIFAYLGTTFFAVVFGLAVALILRPGEGIDMTLPIADRPIDAAKEFSISGFLVDIVPDNIIQSFATGKILHAVFFAIFTGIVLNGMGSKADKVKDLFHVLSKMVLKMISMIVQFSPYGAFALTAWVVGDQGLGIIFTLSKLVGAVVIAMICQYLIFGIMILVFCRVSPIPFYKKSFEYQILAFSTSSSKATLATTMEICQNKLGISEGSTSFVLPLGASINMDGFAINLGLTTIFFAQMMGVDLMLYDYLVIILTATFGSIGGAGIPGASLIILPMVLNAVNLPIEGVAIIAGIDRLLDMLRTTINITGDATITLIIDNSEGTLDKEKYLS